MPRPKPLRRRTLAGGSALVFGDADTACREAAHRIADAIRAKVDEGGRAVLGLATGSTPIRVYGRLVSFFKGGSLSFRDVSTFNLDEYYPMSPVNPDSYRSFMHRHLYGHVDMVPNHAHVLDGTVPEAFVAEHAAQYDRWIVAEGGLDLQMLGLGRNAHIGFNEPTSLPVEQALALPTRLVELHPVTIADAAGDFGGDEDNVPRRALTMGVASILSARSILVLAFGKHKAPAVARSLTGPMIAEVPGSLLQASSARVTWLLDPAAASELAWNPAEES